MEQKNYRRDVILYSLIFIILFLLSVFIPFLILISLFLLPIPIIAFTAKYNVKNGIFIFAIVNLFTFLLASYIGMFLSLFISIGALFIGHKINKGESAYESLMFGSIGYLIGIIIAYVGSNLLFNFDWIYAFETNMRESIDTFISFMSQFGMEQELNQQKDLIYEQIDQLVASFTAIFILTSVFFGFITQWLAYKWLNWREKMNLYYPAFHSFNFPISVIWIHLLAIILSYVSLEEGSFLYLIAVNLLAITTVCIVIQGFSFIFFYFRKKKVHNIIPILIMIFTLIIPIFLIFIRIIGIIDIGFRLKDRMSDNN